MSAGRTALARRAASCAARWLALVLVVLSGAPRSLAAQEAAEAVHVAFVLNDAQVKDRRLPGVQVRIARVGGREELASGVTDAEGRFTAELPPGSYAVSYALSGYVPYTSEATELSADGQLVTVSLSRMLEATAEAARDVRIILNWGSRDDQVKDADSHLACACHDGSRHVYYRNRRHHAGEHTVELDVDDVDWGGPETITLTHPAPGRYLYWVHDYSGKPGAFLGASDVVVRVLVGSEQKGEFRVFKGLTRRSWRPFKAIEVGANGVPALVRFSEDEIAEGRDLEVPTDLQPPDPPPASGLPASLVCPLVALVVAFVIWRDRRRKRQSA